MAFGTDHLSEDWRAMARCNEHVEGIGFPSYACRRRAGHDSQHAPLTRWDARLVRWIPRRIRPRLVRWL